MKQLLIILAAAAMLTACHNKKASSDGEQQPGAANVVSQESRQALTLQQTEQEVARVDSLLEAVKHEHDTLYQWMMDHATELSEQSPQVQQLTQLRLRRDSLQQLFDVLCHRIKYIHRQQNE